MLNEFERSGNILSCNLKCCCVCPDMAHVVELLIAIKDRLIIVIALCIAITIFIVFAQQNSTEAVQHALRWMNHVVAPVYNLNQRRGFILINNITRHFCFLI